MNLILDELKRREAKRKELTAIGEMVKFLRPGNSKKQVTRAKARRWYKSLDDDGRRIFDAFIEIAYGRGATETFRDLRANFTIMPKLGDFMKFIPDVKPPAVKQKPR